MMLGFLALDFEATLGRHFVCLIRTECGGMGCSRLDQKYLRFQDVALSCVDPNQSLIGPTSQASVRSSKLLPLWLFQASWTFLMVLGALVRCQWALSPRLLE
jgi:hypothetical protein